MERFSRANPGAVRDSKTNSVVSMDSNSTRTTGYRNSSADSSSSRPTAYTPSYMNAVPARKPVSPRVQQNGQNACNGSNGQAEPIDIANAQPNSRRTPSANVKKGSLFVFVADMIHPSTVLYLETMLRRGAYSNIAVIGSLAQEKELKSLKIQIYALLGKLSHSSVGVEVKTRERWTETDISGATEEAMTVNGLGEPVHGVLCSPVYGGNERANLMDLNEKQLQVPWSHSVGFLHSVAKAVIPKMRTTAGLFAVTGPTKQSVISTFYKSACESLIDLLSEDAATAGVAIVHAENVLVPEPEPEPQQQHQRAKSNGIQIPAKHGVQQQPEPSEFAPSESPTKLYSMWALHEQLGAD